MNFRKNLTVIYLVLFAVLVAEAAGLLIRSAVIPGLSRQAEHDRDTAMSRCNARTIASGDIYDCRKNRLFSAGGPGEKGIYADDEAYSQIIGYALPVTNQYYRMMAYYKEELFLPAGAEGRKGADIYLTLDQGIQMKALQVLKDEIGEDGEGSVVVMDARTGELKAFVSLPAFNANDLDSSLKEMNSSKEIWYPVTHKKGVPPGSIFKLVTVATVLENGFEDFRTADKEFDVDGVRITNSYKPDGKEIGYKEALVRSSNVYMASAALAIGGDRLTEMAGRFMVGKELELDFGTVVSNWDLDSGNALETAQSAYGQGKILFSTIYGAMMAQAIANDGTMMKPYMVGAIIDQNGKCLKKGEEQVLSKAVSKRTARIIGGAMEEAARSYKMDDTYRIAAKTGTAQIGDADNRYEAWMVSFAPADNPRYVIAMNHCGTKNYGISLKKPVLELYGYLLQ